MTRGLRQACVLLLGGAVAAAAVAGVWTAVGGGSFRLHWAVALMVGAGLLALTGGTALSRASTADVRAFLGRGPDHEEQNTGDGLTGVGVFLFVSLPLLVSGLLLYGSG